ncbi:vacuolar ATPase assembly integral membrane protein vma21 [Entomophthora muscae]|uniref:Vacuolar ATPase assembly integral membrane protein vma21 n=1 Tax=Entomophthora muscae TaxID=34485 RepID=A0ACC2TY69_9FUNG|nr:vacuolar ATPase assembly integral membrane protein vma21 [Entomophthora muscae]
MTVTKRISSEQKDASDTAIKGPISPTSESSKSALLKNKQKPKVEISRLLLPFQDGVLAHFQF